jgi:hypothetical protein
MKQGCGTAQQKGRQVQGEVIRKKLELACLCALTRAVDLKMALR